MEKERARVLLVDDVPTNIQVLKEALVGEYIVTFATDGKKALELAKVEPQPDLILLDIMMPGMDGYEVCLKLQEDKATQGIPVIFVTAKDEEHDEERGFAVGGVDYITKPFSVPLVRARARTHIVLKKHREFIEHLLEEKKIQFEQSEEEYMKLYLRKMDFGFS